MQNSATLPDNAGVLDLSVAFIEAMLERGRRPETLRAYSRDLACFLGFVGDVRPDEVTSADVQAFCEQLASEGKAIASVIRARDVVRAFYGWMRSEGWAAGNPADDMAREAILEGGDRARGATNRSRGPATLDGAAIAAIVSRLWNPDDRLAATLIAATGLAASDVVALRIGQVMFVNDRHPEAPTGIAVLRLVTGHGRVGPQQRMVVISEADVVRELKRRATRGAEGDAPLCPVALRTLTHRFRQAAIDAGHSDVTLRDLKHAAAARRI
ncbi:MAG: site-specific integrase [Candidatus Sericytochromatia bacterium]|nr:site-specific integrase [Candidatus Tanganyikabacteria bacterium]